MRVKPAVFFLTALSTLLITCSPNSALEHGSVLTEPPELAEASLAIEHAFLTGSSEEVQSLIAPEKLSRYKTAIEQNADRLAGFGEILQKRSLVSLDKIYAVYAVSHEGRTYEITMTLDADSTWKLSDF